MGGGPGDRFTRGAAMYAKLFQRGGGWRGGGGGGGEQSAYGCIRKRGGGGFSRQVQ